MRKDPCSLIMTTSPPASAHVIGWFLQGRTRVPWVADFRDLWTDNHYYSYPRPRKALDRVIERLILSRADAMTTVTDFLARRLVLRFPGKPVLTIPNGYNFENGVTQLNPAPQFLLSHTGALYGGKRDPSLLFKALSSLVCGGTIPRTRLRIAFFGEEAPWLRNLAERAGIGDLVKVCGPVPRHVALQIQKRSQALLLPQWNHPDEVGVCPAKLFEYLVARRPVLAFGGPGGAVKEILDRTRAGVHVDTYQEMENALRAWWCEYERSGSISYHGSDHEISQYSHTHMAQRFAALFDSLADS